ncbi:MAG TPA: Ig-like domain-containing protein, partial [Planctomycetota bacterium]|nr:Ig-like domain-containing protein [Planctomycetota bacterium]
VDDAGAVTALKAGQAVITATAGDGGGAAASCQVTVWKEPVAGIAFDKPEVTVKAGEWSQLAVTVRPENASRRNIVRWRSSDAAVAAVDQAGIVIAESAGTASITAEAKDGGFTASCTVTVPPFGSGAWSKVIVLREYLKNYDPRWPLLQNGWWDFPEELVNYELAFPRNTVRANGLRLTTAAGEPVEYQLADVVENRRGFLEKAVLSLRTGLARGEIKGFIFDYDPKYDRDADAQRRVTITPGDRNTAIISANRQQIEVPHGKVVFPGGEAAKDVPAPIIGISRDGKTWTGPGSFAVPEELRVESVTGTLIEEGLLRVRYRVEYAFTGGRNYRVVLTVQHDEQHVTVDEYLEGFSPDDNAWLKFSFAKGIDPDGRLVEANGTYKLTTYRGRFDHNLKPDGRLPYELGLYTPNSYGLTWATVFWKDAGEHALIFNLYRMEDWETARRHVWSSFGPHNLAFYCTLDDKYMITRLEGTERHWALGVIPRSEVILQGQPDGPAAGKTWLVNKDFVDFPGLTHDYYYYDWTYGPEVMLFRKLTDRSLNKYKDEVYDWDESEWLDLPADVTAADWLTQRASKVRDAYIAESDAHMPHKGMMAGHPNFVIYHKLQLARALAQWPHHPHAAQWKAEFMGFFNEWLDLFVRKADPDRNTLGGRHTENLPCYSVHSMMAVYQAAKCLKAYDGTDLFVLPAVREWLRYYLQALMPTENGMRLFPPQGAHASGGLPPEDCPHRQSVHYRPNMIEIARWLRAGTDKPLGETLLWSLTKGTRKEEGTPPSSSSPRCSPTTAPCCGTTSPAPTRHT